jgi:glycerophosphoryl diester phosphodiesterase
MKYIKTYENYTPIKINSAKPFKVKKGLLKNAIYLQKGIKSDRKRLEKEKDQHKRTKLNNDKNSKIKKLRDVSFKTIKQAEYFRNNPVKENYSDDEKKNLMQVLESPDFKPEDIVNYIGLDEEDYKLKSGSYYRYEPEYSKDNITLHVNSKDLERLLNLDDGIINYIRKLTDYHNDYEYYVEDEELNYLNSYLPVETITNIKKFAKLFKFKLKYDKDGIKEGEIVNLFEYLGLKDKLKDFKNEISMEKERAVESEAKDLLKSLPFSLNYSDIRDDKFDIELVFDYSEVIEYIKENNLEVKTLMEFLENVSKFTNDFNYEFETEASQETDGFKDLIRDVDNTIENYTISPDDIFVKLIQVDNLKAFKENFNKAIFSYNYDVYIDYKKVEMNLFKLALYYKGQILDWIMTPEFENKIKNKSAQDFESYEQFIYKEQAAKFNI